MNIGSWFRPPERPPPPSASKDLDDRAGRMDYVDALLNLMVKQSQLIIRLSSARPLPSVGSNDPDTPPSYSAVLNRLKVLCRLNPVCYQEPVQGKIEIPRGSLVLVYEIRFEDKAAPPCCTIQLRIRNL